MTWTLKSIHLSKYLKYFSNKRNKSDTRIYLTYQMLTIANIYNVVLYSLRPGADV